MAQGDIGAAQVADFLERGLLDLLVPLFRGAPELYDLLGELVGDARISVRLGASALVEELAEADPGGRSRAAAALLPLLAGTDPVGRGDAAYLLGVVGGEGNLASLEAVAAGDENADVREIAAEAAGAIAAREHVSRA